MKPVYFLLPTLMRQLTKVTHNSVEYSTVLPSAVHVRSECLGQSNYVSLLLVIQWQSL